MKCNKCGAEFKAQEEFCGECGTPRPGSNDPGPGKTKGMSQNTKGALCYLFGWITGVIFLLTEKENKFVRFHAVQSVVTFIAANIISSAVAPTSYYDSFYGTYSYTDSTLYSLVVLMIVILWILLMYKASQGEKYKLPIVGDFAEKQTQ
jgi:uncharacterized membrane protein